MNATHFESPARTLTTAPSRRTVLRLTLGGTLVGLLTRLGRDDAAAKKMRKRRLKRNSYGCVNVGNACHGKDANCCSGICEGKKPKQGKQDKSRCVNHNTADCSFGQDACLVPIDCGPQSTCYRTTGEGSICGVGALGQCRPCTKDADCTTEFGPGAACIICANDCPEGQETACMPAGV
jgi:hypothetical protein